MTLSEAAVRALDPRGLIRESYRIEGIVAAECRSIFLDWALGVGPDQDPLTAIRALLEHYGPEFPDHPMTTTLTEGLAPAERKGRRGGARARR